ncbi:MAG: hypothetical protein WA020_07870, partial [Candidatus Acidiferrales bacterium]
MSGAVGTSILGVVRRFPAIAKTAIPEALPFSSGSAERMGILSPSAYAKRPMLSLWPSRLVVNIKR